MSSNDNKINVFVDELSLTLIFKLISKGLFLNPIYYFENHSFFVNFLIFIISKNKLFTNININKINHHIGNIKDAKGNSKRVYIHRQALSICRNINHQELDTSSLIEKMSESWDRKKIKLFFKKIIESEVKKEIFRIELILWIHKFKFDNELSNCILFLKKTKWISYIKDFAAEKNLPVVFYYGRTTNDFTIKNYKRYIVRLTKLCQFIFSRVIRFRPGVAINLKSVSNPKHKNNNKEYDSPVIGVQYYHRKISLDPTERSEIFWHKKSGIKLSDILIYDYYSENRSDISEIYRLQNEGMRFLGNCRGVQEWKPTVRALSTFIEKAKILIKNYLFCLFKDRLINGYYLIKFFKLIISYSYWYDFYLNNNVKVNVGTNNVSVEQTLALKDLNSISLSYQYSSSNLLFPTHNFSAGEDVQFVFSERFEELRKEIGTPIGVFIKTGFIYDSAIKYFDSNDRVSLLRQKLKDNGAKFIVCYFDEGSFNRWDVPAPDEETEVDYQYLLTWLLRDPSLGIIFKPKKSKTLFDRISNIETTTDQALRSGRCIFLKSDNIYGNIYPAEAALAADVSIGKLIGNTAGLESFLAGVPTVLIDNEGIREHPFYRWGLSHIVYKDWPSLQNAIERYREKPEKAHRFGNWESGIENLDKFRDGASSLRIGIYIKWIYKYLASGKSKEYALSRATEKFSETWG